MRKKGKVLRDVADPAKPRRNMQHVTGVEKDLAIEHYPAGRRPAKPGNHFKEGRFPRTGRTENAGDGTIERGIDLQGEVSEGELKMMEMEVYGRLLDVEIICPPRTVTKTMKIETRRRGNAAASWPSWMC